VELIQMIIRIIKGVMVVMEHIKQQLIHKHIILKVGLLMMALLELIVVILEAVVAHICTQVVLEEEEVRQVEQ
jgi:hypothetical protein